MFAVKIISDDIRKNITLNSTAANIFNFLKNNLTRKINIISDSTSIEAISGSVNTNNAGIVTELTFKKVIRIDESDLLDKQKLDRYIKEVKHFLEQVAKIEDLQYVPINYRQKENAE